LWWRRRAVYIIRTSERACGGGQTDERLGARARRRTGCAG
jgi:hypothetical protein